MIIKEDRRQMYKDIVYRLRVINNKIVDLNSSVVSMKDIINKNILVNDNCYKIDTIKNINNTLNSTYYNIYNNIIPSLNRKT